MEDSSPEMLIVAGPNGAGKTTLAMSYAGARDAKYIGADKIAYDISPENPYAVRMKAGEEFIRQINELGRSMN